MKKLQIQLPDPLYRDIKILAKHLDYSLAEILRRGAEQVILFYPHLLQDSKKSKQKWNLPKAKNLGLKITNPEELRKLANQRS